MCMMRIQFERTGGFAGMKLVGAFDSESLSAAEARQLSKMIESAQLLDWPEQDGAKLTQGADQFQYKISIEIQSRQRTIMVNDGNAPEAVLPLLDWLTDKSRQTAIAKARETTGKETVVKDKETKEAKGAKIKR